MPEAVPAMPPAWAGEVPATDTPKSADAPDAADAVESEPGTAAAEPAPEYVGRRRARPVVLGFRDGSEVALDAGTPAARALRAMATALGSHDANPA